MKTSARLLFLGLAVCLVFAPQRAFADASADLAKINAHLKRALVNLDSVNRSIGQRTSPPKGSAAKLAASRLNQAKGDLDAAGKLLGGVPKDEKGVAETIARYKAAVALHTKLIKILNGGDAPKEPEIKDGEVKLGYPHADNFKNTQFTFRNKVEGPANQLVKLHAKLKPVKDQMLINHRTTAQVLAAIKEARRQAGFVKEGLDKLPANGQGVAAAKKNLELALESIKGSEDYFKPLHAKLMAMIDPAKFPKFDEDRKRLRGLAGDYGAEWVFTSDRARAAELFAQRKAAQDELVRIAKKYQRLMQQKTDMGVAMEAAGQGALKSYQAFDKRVVEQKKSLPAEILKHLAEAQKMGDQAVAEQRPAWFGGGIPQRMAWAEDKITLLKAIDPKGSEPVVKQLAETEAKLKKQAESLKQLIIRENRVPADKYVGDDREAIIKVAKSGWAVQQKDAKVLKVVIPAEAWSREKKWTYSNGTWYFSDKSRLQVRLVVADHENPKQAISRPVNIVKNHLKGDTMIGLPFRSFDEPLTPSEYYLIENVK